jgi:hypothetical protein
MSTWMVLLYSSNSDGAAQLEGGCKAPKDV